jgi:hypothetical protein
MMLEIDNLSKSFPTRDGEGRFSSARVLEPEAGKLCRHHGEAGGVAP